ncbi:MAG: 3-dehydroquinate synthase family protein [Phycisphaerales bacterium]
MSESVRVKLGDRGYDVVVGPGTLTELGTRTRAAVGDDAGRAFVVIDAGVPDASVASATESLNAAGFDLRSHTFDPTERVKSIETVRAILEQLAETGQDRSEPVVALGGGIVGDVAGFVAATYRRGVPVVQCPTTLLAMVDASVGGKTGVNLELPGGRLFKNMVGSFHQPGCVIADVGVLASLAPRHVRAGFAECIKHAMIAQSVSGADLMGWLEANLDAALAGDAGVLSELVRRNVAVKADAVVSDERETAPSAVGGRALLNLGHTFGHAIETLPGISPDASDASLAPLHHGEAVGLGLIAACACARSLGMVDDAWAARVRAVVERAGLPMSVRGLPGDDELIERMGHDKKVRAGVLRLVLPEGAGRCRVVDAPDRGAIVAGLGSIRG